MNAGSEIQAKRPLRILQVLRAPVGGLFRHVCDLTQKLNELGHAVGIVCDSTAADPFWNQRLQELAPHARLGITTLPIGRLLSIHDFSSISKLYKLTLNKNIDIIHGHGAKGGAYARLAGRLAQRHNQNRKPATIYTPHGGSLHYRKGTPSGLLYHTLERALFPLTSRLLFESTYSRTRYGALINSDADAFTVIHNGLNPSEFLPIDISSDATTLVYAGELRELKGVGVLLQAVMLLPQDVTLTLIGSGRDENLFRARVAASDLGHRVRFMAPRPVREALAFGKIAILPSLAESMPYIILESLAARHPIIATRVGGIPEIFGADESHLISPHNPQALAKAISDGLFDMNALQSKTNALSDYVCKNFTLDNMVNRIINEYHQALN